MSQSPNTAANKPGRYNRSVGGLVGSMIVLVVAVIAFVAFRGAVRADPEMEVESFDYVASVRAAQDAGFPAAYPTALADGWQATPGGFGRGDVPEFSLNFLTDTDGYVGIKVAADGAGAVLTRVLGEQYESEPEVEVANSDDLLGGTWDAYSEGDDTAIVRELPAGAASVATATAATDEPGDVPTEAAQEDAYVLVVVGSIGVDGLVDFAEDLSLAPISG